MSNVSSSHTLLWAPTHAPFILFLPPLCPPPSSTIPHSSPALLHCPLPSLPFLSYPVVETLRESVLNKLLQTHDCWEVTGTVVSFFSPLPQCFFFSSPLHIVCLMCPDVQHFFEDGLKWKTKSCCVSIEFPRSLTVLPERG